MPQPRAAKGGRAALRPAKSTGGEEEAHSSSHREWDENEANHRYLPPKKEIYSPCTRRPRSVVKVSMTSELQVEYGGEPAATFVRFTTSPLTVDGSCSVGLLQLVCTGSHAQNGNTEKALLYSEGVILTNRVHTKGP